VVGFVYFFRYLGGQ